MDTTSETAPGQLSPRPKIPDNVEIMDEVKDEVLEVAAEVVEAAERNNGDPATEDSVEHASATEKPTDRVSTAY